MMAWKLDKDKRITLKTTEKEQSLRKLVLTIIFRIKIYFTGQKTGMVAIQESDDSN